MPQKPLLSIVVPVYNTSALLPRCIESVLAQSYTTWELLLVNDGSTDNSLEICQHYAEQDERIRVFTQSNQGQSVARNLALEHAQGAYIAFLDSDDAFTPELCEGAISTLLANEDCDIVVLNIRSTTQSNTTFDRWDNHSKVLGEEARRKLLDGAYRLISCNKIYSRASLQGLRFMPGIVFEDNLLIFELAKRLRGICFSPEGFYEYHQEEHTADKFVWSERNDRSTIVVYLNIIGLYQGSDSFERSIRLETYRKLINYLYPRLMRRDVEPKLEPAVGAIAQMKLSELWRPSAQLSLRYRFKMSSTCLWAMVYRYLYAKH